MIPGLDARLSDAMAFQPAGGLGNCSDSSGRAGDCQACKWIVSWASRPTKLCQERSLRLAQHIDNKRCAQLDRGQEVASAIDGERDQWRHKTGLHHPTSEHAAIVRIIAPCHHKEPAGYFSQHGGDAVGTRLCYPCGSLIGDMGKSDFILGEWLGMGHEKKSGKGQCLGKKRMHYFTNYFTNSSQSDKNGLVGIEEGWRKPRPNADLSLAVIL